MNKNKQIALITGASSGIGAEIAIQLAKKNIHTIITARSLSRLIKTEKSIIDNEGTCTVVELDMKDLHGLDNLGKEIFKRWGKLDILIANAAMLNALIELDSFFVTTTAFCTYIIGPCSIFYVIY